MMYRLRKPLKSVLTAAVLLAANVAFVAYALFMVLRLSFGWWGGGVDWDAPAPVVLGAQLATPHESFLLFANAEGDTRADLSGVQLGLYGSRDAKKLRSLRFNDSCERPVFLREVGTILAEPEEAEPFWLCWTTEQQTFFSNLVRPLRFIVGRVSRVDGAVRPLWAKDCLITPVPQCVSVHDCDRDGIGDLALVNAQEWKSRNIQDEQDPPSAQHISVELISSRDGRTLAKDETTLLPSRGRSAGCLPRYVGECHDGRGVVLALCSEAHVDLYELHAAQKLSFLASIELYNAAGVPLQIYGLTGIGDVDNDGYADCAISAARRALGDRSTVSMISSRMGEKREISVLPIDGRVRRELIAIPDVDSDHFPELVFALRRPSDEDQLVLWSPRNNKVLAKQTITSDVYEYHWSMITEQHPVRSFGRAPNLQILRWSSGKDVEVLSFNARSLELKVKRVKD
ncbi:MAG: hypothetical protein JNJ88_01760 [Planctomycetes bacterium]|nr:hypothetical protein [Planctomycetota bacterium]